MPEETNGNASPSRLDRIEHIVEVLANTQIDLQQETKILLAGQVVMQDALTKLAEAEKDTDLRLNALIAIVDDLVRRQPPTT